MVCVFCVFVYNWGGIVDGTDSPVWAVGGRWRLDVGGVRGVTITTGGVGRVSCHSVSADDSGDMRLRLRRNPQPSSRRQSCVPTLYLVTSEEVLKNKSIQMKVRFVSCVWSFSRPLLCQQMGMPCPRLWRCHTFATWAEFQMIKLKGTAVLIYCTYEARMITHTVQCDFEGIRRHRERKNNTAVSVWLKQTF